MSPYYQSSHKMPLGGVLLTLLGGLAAALVLALAYVYLEWYIPVAYFNFLLTFLFGGALGWVVHRLARRGHLRSPGRVAWLGAAVGAVAVYVQWALYLTLVSGVVESGKESGASFDGMVFVGLLMQPASIWKLMHLVAADGVWSVLGVTPSGIFLWLLWLAEALIIVLVSATYGADAVDQPYSETTRSWAAQETLPQLLAPQPDLEATRAALEAGRFDQALLPAPAAPDELGEFWQLRLHRVPEDAACHYLSLDKLTRKLDKKGKPETDTDPLIQHLALTPAQYAALAARFGTGHPQAVP